MKKSIGVKGGIFPMPVLMIATYNEDGSIDVMNAAWGMMADINKVALNLTETHKTVENIKRTGAFTVSFADWAHMMEADYVGIVSGHNVPDKFIKSGLHASKSKNVDAPVIDEFPLCMECKFIEYQSDETGVGVIGEIVNILADESILDTNGKVDVSLMNALAYDPYSHRYYVAKEKVGNAFQEGSKLK